MFELRAVGLAGLGFASIGFAWLVPLVSAGAAGLEDGPMIVVSRPWGEAAEAIVERAGASVVGPSIAPLSVLAAGATADAYKMAGAWAVLSPQSLPFLCAEEAPK